MVVPFIPIVPQTRTTVVNKTIVYSDTVLPLKDAGSNLKVCSISDVRESSLEECLKVIFNNNAAVIFNTVQYSKDKHKVYFYTDKEINTKAWDDRKCTTYRPLKNNQEILEEIREVLGQERNKEKTQVSLYDLLNLIRSRESKYKKIIKEYKNVFDSIIKNKYGSSSSIVIYSFDHKKRELNIGFKFISSYDKITFSQTEDGDIYVSKSESYRAKEILSLLAEQLSRLFKELIAFDDFDRDYDYDCQLANSNFRVSMSKYGVDVFNNRYVNDKFKISSYSYNNDYSSECNSSIVLEVLKGKEDMLFKKLFVDIDKCPNWSRSLLILLREEQLVEEELREEEQRRLEMKRKEKELKKQNRRKTLRKIFPFLK